MHRVIFMALVAVFGTGLTPAAAAPATRPTYTHAARDVVQSYRLDEEWGLEASATHVEGTGVGAGCTEGHWHRQAVELLQTGSSEDFANLVRERSLSLRTLGVYCLARTGGEQPAAILRSLFADETKIQVCYGGCIVRSTTLGVFAEEMAWNSQFLEGGFKPALPPQELMVRAITRVDTVARGFESRGGVPPGRYFALIGQLIAWDSSWLKLPELQRQMPHLSAQKILWYIDGIQDSPALRQFLARCVKDEQLERSARIEAYKRLDTNHLDPLVAEIRTKYNDTFWPEKQPATTRPGK